MLYRGKVSNDTMCSKKRRTYSEYFKKQMVSLYESGKSSSELIDTFRMSRSLSTAGVLYDNAVAEATFTLIKT